MVGWTVIRVVSLTGWPLAASEAMDQANRLPSLPLATPALARPAPPYVRAPAPATVSLWARHRRSSQQHEPVPAPPSLYSQPASRNQVNLGQPIGNLSALAHRPRDGEQSAGPAWQVPPPGTLFDQQGQPATDRWHLGFWALWRAGGGPGRAAIDGRLGGSQIGARLDFDLTPGAPGRVASYARVSTAMNRPASPEAAVGLSYQPARRLPLTIALERRIALGPGGRNANSLYAAGGFGPKAIGPSLTAEAYVQAGLVGFRATDGFVDGKLAVLTPLRHTGIQVGMSVSGGAQPHVSRVDIGPEIQFRLPLPNAAARLSLEWRERIVGNAAPPSGPAITLATDF